MLRGGIIADAIQRLDQHPCAGNLHARNRAIALIGDMVRICQLATTSARRSVSKPPRALSRCCEQGTQSDETRAAISETPGMLQALISISHAPQEHLFTKV